MTIDKLAENRVLIILEENDMKEFAIDYDGFTIENSASRKALERLMHLACSKSGITVNGRRIIMEAISLGNECYILLTVSERQRHTYRLKKSSGSLCYNLGSIGNFLNAVEKLYRQNVCCNHNSAYVCGDEYYLIFDYPAIPEKLRRILSEYSERKGGSILSARIRESGKLICSSNAIALIGKFMV